MATTVKKKPAKPAPKPRLSAKDWELAALKAIAEEGTLGAVAVEPLARRLGVTKGSFYWHFDGADALLETTLLRWERVFTTLKFQRLGQLPGPGERLRRLFTEAAGDREGQTVFLAISAAGQQPFVQPLLERVTKARLKFLRDNLQELGFDPKEAYQQALLIYTSYIGLIHLFRDMPEMSCSEQNREAFLEHVFSQLVQQ